MTVVEPYGAECVENRLMSVSSQSDWREEALRSMNLADAEPSPDELGNPSHSLAIVLIKLGILLLMALPMVVWLGYSWLFALIFVGWLLFSYR